MRYNTLKKIAISDENNQIHTDKSSKSKQIRITDSTKIKSPCVTTCLTNSHDECTGSYEFRLGEFKIECRCKCHNNLNLLLGGKKSTDYQNVQSGGQKSDTWRHRV